MKAHFLPSIAALMLCMLLDVVSSCPAQTLVVTPSQLTFTMTADSTSVPAAQTLLVTSPIGSVAFSASVSPYGYGGAPPFAPVYLSVSPSSGVTPATLTVSLLPVALSWGYGGYYNVVGVTAGDGGVAVHTYLDVKLPPPPVVSSVVNAASFQSGVSPGAIVTIFGDHIGPGVPAAGYASPSSDAPTQVYYSPIIGYSKVAFNGHLAPLLYASSGQINAVVPYDVAGQASVQMVVSHDLVAAAAVTVPVLDTSPGVFTADGSGSGPGAILNQDNTLNSAKNPAPVGSVIQIFGTGAGLWNTPVGDGLEVPYTRPFPLVAAQVNVTIGGLPAQVTYAGAAPGLVSGALQVNAMVPIGVPSGPQVMILSIGQNSNSSQRVTVATE